VREGEDYTANAAGEKKITRDLPQNHRPVQFTDAQNMFNFQDDIDRRGTSSAKTATDFDREQCRGLLNKDLPQKDDNLTKGAEKLTTDFNKNFPASLTLLNCNAHAAATAKCFREFDDRKKQMAIQQENTPMETQAKPVHSTPAQDQGDPVVQEIGVEKRITEHLKQMMTKAAAADADNPDIKSWKMLSQTQQEYLIQTAEFYDEWVSAVLQQPGTTEKWPTKCQLLLGAGGAGKTHTVKNWLVQLAEHAFKIVAHVPPSERCKRKHDPSEPVAHRQ